MLNFEGFFIVKIVLSRLKSISKLRTRCLVITALWLDVDRAEDLREQAFGSFLLQGMKNTKSGEQTG